MKYTDLETLWKRGERFYTPCCLQHLGKSPVLPVRCSCRKRDRGVGDTVERMLKRLGIKKRGGCGCSKRQRWLNKRFPYTH